MSVFEKIAKLQQKEKGRTAPWMVGEQLKDMVRREPEIAEILERDLDIESMSLREAEKKIREYASNHRTGNFACVTPVESERILREFYGLGKTAAAGHLSVIGEADASLTPLSVGFADISPRRGESSPERGAKGGAGDAGDAEDIIDLGAFL